MKQTARMATLILLTGSLGAYGQTAAKTPPGAPTAQQQQSQQPTGRHGKRSPGGDIGSGNGDIGKGAGKGAGSAAKGAGSGAADLVTLHPLNAAGAVGKGGAVAGKDVGVGAAKGTGKIVKGTGRAIKHIF